jgi:hypothetical protein
VRLEKTAQRETTQSARFQVLTAVSMKMITFCDIVPCSLVVVDRRFSTKIMEAVCTSEMMVYYKETTWYNIPEGYHLHTQFVLFIKTLIGLSNQGE